MTVILGFNFAPPLSVSKLWSYWEEYTFIHMRTNTRLFCSRCTMYVCVDTHRWWGRGHQNEWPGTPTPPAFVPTSSESKHLHTESYRETKMNWSHSGCPVESPAWCTGVWDGGITSFLRRAPRSFLMSTSVYMTEILRGQCLPILTIKNKLTITEYLFHHKQQAAHMTSDMAFNPRGVSKKAGAVSTTHGLGNQGSEVSWPALKGPSHDTFLAFSSCVIQESAPHWPNYCIGKLSSVLTVFFQKGSWTGMLSFPACVSHPSHLPRFQVTPGEDFPDFHCSYPDLSFALLDISSPPSFVDCFLCFFLSHSVTLFSLLVVYYKYHRDIEHITSFS